METGLNNLLLIEDFSKFEDAYINLMLKRILNNITQKNIQIKAK